MKRPLILLLLLFVALLAVPRFFSPPQSPSIELLSLTGSTMGTSYHIKVVPNPQRSETVDTLQQRVQQRLDQINHLMSTYQKDSELSRINQAKAEQWMPVSDETLLVILTAQQVSQDSDGAFDITIGNLVNLWGFGPTINLHALPDPQKISTLRDQVGYTRLRLDTEHRQVAKGNDQLYLDLSAIAKGYAVDAVAELLSASGYQHYMVEIGGEIRTRGQKSATAPWAIGIEEPITDGRNIQKILHLGDAAMATSGDYRNYFEQDGKRYSHTIDPRTGYPIEHRLASVSVLSDSCMLADAYATTLMVMGPERGMAWAEKMGLAVYMIIKEEKGFSTRASHLFDKYAAAH
ncbi:MAG: FAD:protein FMN transferase [Desulfuromonadaceae bacterium]|nr:FAD:protein FMN transferase [Desulfuromonadaceae bacterium]